MRPVFLIAANFLRENRWAILLMAVFSIVSGIGSALLVRGERGDALYLLKQQAAYSVLFTVFVAAQALHNQRRSRRILAVLSKGISRSQYLAGIVVGFLGVSAIYAVTFGITGAITFSLAGYNPLAIVALMLFLFLSAGMAGALALFFSTFMSPLLTLAATMLVISIAAFLGPASSLIAGYPLMHSVMEFNFEHGFEFPRGAVLIAVIEGAVLWAASSVVFARKDIAVSIE
ncbi:MAG TPA: hypothetical protein VGF08_00045 [Terriglobales bacterium]|jgi:ABC-type transport system involved in multi-copper enzyme maturation permease subunit